MDEIFRIADRAVILRNGMTVGEVVISESNEDEIVNMMVGGNLGLSREIIDQMDFSDKDTILKVEDIENDRLSGVSFDIKQGELVGIGGLRGQGQSSLLHTLFGNNHYTGTITLFDEVLDFDHPKKRWTTALL